MTTQTTPPIVEGVVSLSTIDAVASVLGRYGLVVVIGWIGALKFANFEHTRSNLLLLIVRSWAGSTTSYPCIRSQPY